MYCSKGIKSLTVRKIQVKEDHVVSVLLKQILQACLKTFRMGQFKICFFLRKHFFHKPDITRIVLNKQDLHE